jgi:lipopolysaccharide/colanic/teichoic acid biosynthesis glycosyltransferase
VLRRFSIDEIPQLYNVLKGDMSLVGPRPHMPSEVAHYKDWQRRKFDVLPGMTGLTQVRGRKDLSLDEMVKLDIYYIENWSSLLDLQILLKTIPTVWTGKGAY